MDIKLILGAYTATPYLNHSEAVAAAAGRVLHAQITAWLANGADTHAVPAEAPVETQSAVGSWRDGYSGQSTDPDAESVRSFDGTHLTAARVWRLLDDTFQWETYGGNAGNCATRDIAKQKADEALMRTFRPERELGGWIAAENVAYRLAPTLVGSACAVAVHRKQDARWHVQVVGAKAWRWGFPAGLSAGTSDEAQAMADYVALQAGWKATEWHPQMASAGALLEKSRAEHDEHVAQWRIATWTRGPAPAKKQRAPRKKKETTT